MINSINVYKKEGTKQPLKFYLVLINLLFIISCYAFSMINFNSLMFFNANVKIISIVFLVVFLVYFLFIFNRNFVFNNIILIGKNKTVLIISVFATIGYALSLFEFINIQNVYKWVYISLSLFLVFILFNIVYKLIIEKLIIFIKSLTRNEKLFVLCAGIFSTLLIMLTLIFTVMFTGKGGWYEVLSFDVSHMYIDNAYINPISYMSNNIRHLLLSLFSIPFMILPYLISKILFLPILMPIFVQFIHSAMIIIVIILIKRMLNIRDTKLEAIFYLLFFTSSTTILNLLVYEKFVISMFYLVLTVYATHKNNAYKYILFIASIGTLSTNIFLAPFVFYDKNKKFGDIMREIIICIVSFIFIIVLYGQINNLVFFQKGLNSVLQFSGNDLSFIYKLAQFFEMFCTFFIIPKTNPIDSSLWYHTSQIDSVYSIIGMFKLYPLSRTFLFICSRERLFVYFTTYNPL